MQRSYWARLYADDEAPGYTVDVPDLPGCITEGDSWDEAMYMAADAMRGWLEDELENGRPLPAPRGREEMAALPVEADMGEAILAEVTVDLFSDRALSAALWADLAKISRQQGLPVGELLDRAVREFLGRQGGAER